MRKRKRKYCIFQAVDSFENYIYLSNKKLWQKIPQRTHNIYFMNMHILDFMVYKKSHFFGSKHPYVHTCFHLLISLLIDTPKLNKGHPSLATHSLHNFEGVLEEESHKGWHGKEGSYSAK